MALREALVELGPVGFDTMIATYAEAWPAAAREPERRNRPRDGLGALRRRREGEGRAPRRTRRSSIASTAPETSPYAVDFRAYYATLLDRWWAMDPALVLGAKFTSLRFV